MSLRRYCFCPGHLLLVATTAAPSRRLYVISVPVLLSLLLLSPLLPRFCSSFVATAPNPSVLVSRSALQIDPGDERRCLCGLTPRAHYAFTVFNTGRRFLKCPRPFEHQCEYFDWLDVTQTEKEVEFGKIVYKRFSKLNAQMQENTQKMKSMFEGLTGDLEKVTAKFIELKNNSVAKEDVDKLVEENMKLKMTVKVLEEMNNKKHSSPLFGICIAIIICLAWILTRDW